MTYAVFMTLRLPRTLMAVLAGAGLSLAGYIYQLLFKKYSGFSRHHRCGKRCQCRGRFGDCRHGCRFRACAHLCVLRRHSCRSARHAVCKNGHRNSLATIVLSGIVVSAMAEAVIMILKLLADPNSELAPLEYWSMGGLSAITASKVLWVLPFFLPGMVALFLVRYQITILGLSNEEAFCFRRQSEDDSRYCTGRHDSHRFCHCFRYRPDYLHRFGRTPCCEDDHAEE